MEETSSRIDSEPISYTDSRSSAMIRDLIVKILDKIEYDPVPYVMGGFILFVLFAFYHVGKAQVERKQEFMEDCMQHRPKYECTVLWRSGDPEVVVQPVYIPSN